MHNCIHAVEVGIGITSDKIPGSLNAGSGNKIHTLHKSHICHPLSENHTIPHHARPCHTMPHHNGPCYVASHHTPYHTWLSYFNFFRCKIGKKWHRIHNHCIVFLWSEDHFCTSLSWLFAIYHLCTSQI